MQEHGVEALLMGGQACVLYGAAEFSRDADFAVLATTDNLDRLGAALAALDAVTVAVPPFDVRHLERGHAVHFRCRHPEALGLRVDVMTRLRGVDAFPVLWARRATWDLPDSVRVEGLSLPDLVASKKTQRDKDWPMVRRLVEVSYDGGIGAPTPERVAFWLRELRTPALLIECATMFPADAEREAAHRPAVRAALAGDAESVETELNAEEARERALDRAYWAPLKAELEQMRRET
ncbi:MAG: hypothetical protein WD043_10530 [Gemmatimonadales bacterium]